MLRSRVFSAALRQTPLRSSRLRTPSSLLTPTSLFRYNRPPTRQISSPTFIARPCRLRTRPSLIRQCRSIRHNSSKTTHPVTQEHVSKPAQSVSDRFKELSRKYGWAAVGVYLGLSVLDFPFCFLAVRLVGPDRIGEVEHAIVHGFWDIVGLVVPSMKPESKASVEAVEAEARESYSVEVEGHKIKEDASMTHCTQV